MEWRQNLKKKHRFRLPFQEQASNRTIRILSPERSSWRRAFWTTKDQIKTLTAGYKRRERRIRRKKTKKFGGGRKSEKRILNPKIKKPGFEKAKEEDLSIIGAVVTAEGEILTRLSFETIDSCISWVVL